jgi:hypothetical protein
VTLSREIVDFVRLHTLDDAQKAHRIRHVAVVQDEPTVRYIRSLVKMVNAIGVEERRAALDAVDLIPFIEQKLSEIRAILASNARDQGNRSVH